ncbi:uncharacterized protein LOC112685934 isoform X2 [Sipha flava]|uniref:Uncharacterized protein LOC112685934 isoform X2 n=1 Tax=Sipha flava TaxID=143950 RepID=A0A8B8FTM6_9HEMI|nr:uncharacterized protein LOC112685934 isoform X2 [Sipha flava]
MNGRVSRVQQLFVLQVHRVRVKNVECEGEDGEGGEVVIADEPIDVGAETAVSLETVVEEDDDEDQPLQDKQDRTIVHESVNSSENSKLRSSTVPVCTDVSSGGGHNDHRDVTVGATDADVVIVDAIGPVAAGRPGRVATSATVTDDVLAADEGSDRDGGGRVPRQRQLLDAAAGDEPDTTWTAAGEQPQHPDAAVLQPHTACFETGNNRQLHDLTVDEVIDAIQDPELRDKLRTVCLTGDRCYMTFANAEYLERALHTAFRIRDVPVLLMDTGAGAIILSLTGVPDAVTDKDVLKCLKKYGTIIGGVDRKTARGGATGGERYVRVRPTLGAPRYLWFGSDKVVVRQLTEHETDTMNSIARRKSFRSQIKLNLKMIDSPVPPDNDRVGPSTDCGNGDGSKENVSGGGGGDGGGVGGTSMTAVSVQNGFRFPSDPKGTAASGTGTAASVAEPKAWTTASFKSTGSSKKPKAAANGDGCPPTAASVSSGPGESPLRGRRRTSLMGFRRETIKHRGGSVSRADGGGEDADSDTSTICRRKLSITGREGTEKVPWCGCWGNGCL